MERLENKPQVKKAMILAGGLGTRFLPATLCLAKELFPIGNKPIIMYHIDDLIKAGIDDILIVGNALKADSFSQFLNPSEEYLKKVESDGKMPLLADYFDMMGKVKITYVNQDAEKFLYHGEVYENEGLGQRGSAIAILAGRGWANGEPFVVLNGDDLCFYKDGTSMTQEVVNIYNQTGDCVVYGKEMPRDLMWKYSSMVIGNDVANGKGAKLHDIIEKPERGTEPSNIMGFCRYVLNEEFFKRIFTVKPRSNGEWNMTDVLQKLAQDGLMSTCIFGGDYFDCGSMSGYALANSYVAANDKDSKAAVKEGLERQLGM